MWSQTISHLHLLFTVLLLPLNRFEDHIIIKRHVWINGSSFCATPKLNPHLEPLTDNPLTSDFDSIKISSLIHLDNHMIDILIDIFRWYTPSYFAEGNNGVVVSEESILMLVFLCLFYSRLQWPATIDITRATLKVWADRVQEESLWARWLHDYSRLMDDVAI